VDPLHPPSVKQLTPHLHVLVILDRLRHEPDSRLRLAGEQQTPVADHAVAEEARRSVQEHDIEPLAWNDAPEAREQTGQFGAPVVGIGLGNEDGHVRVPEILTGRIPEILSGLRKETGDESAEREGI